MITDTNDILFNQMHEDAASYMDLNEIMNKAQGFILLTLANDQFAYTVRGVDGSLVSLLYSSMLANTVVSGNVLAASLKFMDENFTHDQILEMLATAKNERLKNEL
jgi:hypothetical protein